MNQERALLRALIVEDQEDDAFLLKRELERLYQLQWRRVDTKQELLSALWEESWSIVLADYSMPQFNGIQALEVVREQDPHLPFIFVSGTMGEEIAVKAIKAGAQDYIVKGQWRRLLPAVERELREAQQRKHNLRMEAKRRAAEARFQMVLATAADAIILVDAKQNILTFNQGAELTFGYSAEEVIGQPVEHLIPKRLRRNHHRHIEDFVADMRTSKPMSQNQLAYGLHRDGHEFPIETTISKLIIDGELTFTVILRDVTDRKRNEDDLRLLQSVTQTASEAQDLPAALNAILANLCKTASWSLGQAWLPMAGSGTLVCASAWHGEESGLEPFRQESLDCKVDPGEDIPGRIWIDKRPLWVVDVCEHGNFLRTTAAMETGIHTALAVPVMAADKVIAVLEFFSRERRPPDERMIGIFSTVATQVAGVIQRRQAEERLHHLAYYDTLTNLPNRLLFVDRLKQAMVEARRHQRQVGVAFLDLDRFKTINDSMGHSAGDELLKAVALRLAESMRPGDTVARLSGDEFALILADMNRADDAAHVARKILDDFNQPFNLEGHEIHTNASLGLTLYPTDERHVDGLLRNADIAMYRAKEAHGNTYAFYSPDMTVKAHERLTLENDLRRSLEQGELALHYQSLVDLRSGNIIGLEALLRWWHPSRGFLLPQEFIGLAEETGLIVGLGEWALEQALRHHNLFTDAAGLPIKMAVNISPRQFQHNNLLKSVKTSLTKIEVDPTCLDLEITESLLLNNSDMVIATIHELGQLGVRFSVDDFGTGYSNFAYLKNLPISQIKIDQSFVQHMTTNPSDAAIVEAIISMAHSLGLQTIAEGVETSEQLGILRELGCDAAQGYYFNMPMASEEVVHLLARKQRPPWH